MADLVFGAYPMPGYLKRLITNKPEGVGWDNLGTRTPRFIVLHRMIGSLWGTDAYFRDPSVGALTDFGVGVAATDGAENAGVIIEWCDPEGTMTPWASGPVSAPYGDGACVLDALGGNPNIANINGVSIEISGNQTTPIDDVAYGELVKLCAYWCDHMHVPSSSMPINPATGCSAYVWHQEFTIGTGKECPFSVVMDLTNQLISDVAVVVQPYQSGGEVPEPEPEPHPPAPDDEAPRYPPGMSEEYAARLYGEITITGVEIAYTYNGDIASRHWLNRYKGQIPAGGTYTHVPWPFLVDVIRRGDNASADYQWSDGHVYNVPREKWSDALEEAFA